MRLSVTKNTNFRGFLYCPATAQFLLQQNTFDEKGEWVLLNGPGKSFAKIIHKLLKIKAKAKDVFFIYDYTVRGIKNVISYALVKKPKDFPVTKTCSFVWLTQKELSKIPLSSQTKQDLIVGQRVIASEVRRDAGEQTIG